ncbi:hypothetical protein F3Y22_tig00003725pilonHSYRG00140 [Hibiscus syriacus]|uniref:Uncharacterized protein n=1 Tax=Hibiscus syriacus TaxID=106335 RepID=A0A6A3CJ90_HIBSY|nr:hypothetical protein F3Y22_tig00003725pilonHSYRG00140 [Hibiscus syriacus]
MDQNASKRIAVKTQNLYPLLPKKPAMEELSFFRVVTVGCEWIAIERDVGESSPFSSSQTQTTKTLKAPLFLPC